MIEARNADPSNRGRQASRPHRIPMRGWLDILYRVLRRIMPTQLGLIAAGVAFYALLAVFPAIAALLALAGLFTDPIMVVSQLQALTELLPDDAALILLQEAQMVAGSPEDGLSLTLFLGVGFALYLATRATTSMIHGLNIAYEEAETRSFLRFWFTVIVMTASFLFGGTVLMVLLVGLPAALAFIPMDIETERWISIARWLLIAVVVMGGLAMFYRFAPARRRAKWSWLTPGAAAAGLLWFAGSMGFTLYVANFGNYNQTFGSLGGVIILLTWLWLSAFIVLLGALLDAEIEAQTRHDSTVGPDRPMGERGAYKADNLGEGLSEDT
ncbi:MAG: YihY/virulence factor BrkB family protein [Silicimonas sp.]|nr:YihY/virulence factor BrkB family protein [Silicimonas sp.]